MNNHQALTFSFFKGNNFKGNPPVIKAGYEPFKRRVLQHYIRRAVKQARIDTFRSYPMLICAFQYHNIHQSPLPFKYTLSGGD
jgi:hypothetical protein